MIAGSTETIFSRASHGSERKPRISAGTDSSTASRPAPVPRVGHAITSIDGVSRESIASARPMLSMMRSSASWSGLRVAAKTSSARRPSEIGTVRRPPSSICSTRSSPDRPFTVANHGSPKVPRVVDGMTSASASTSNRSVSSTLIRPSARASMAASPGVGPSTVP